MKQNKTKQNNILIVFAVLLLVLSILGTLISVTFFWVGYHNLDTGHNARVINLETGRNYIDMGIDGAIRNSYEMYSLGVNQIIKSFVLLGASVFLWGLNTGILFMILIEE